MTELYTTSTDVLYLVISIVIGVLGLLLAIAIYHLIRILSNVNKVSQKAKDTMDLVNHYLWQPIKISLMVLEKLKEKMKEK